jgi:isopentenyl-diphosphate Delta-isomerase
MTMVDPGDVEMVVLLDADGRPCGSAAKSAVHHRDTPLHLAFSCWLVDDEGRTLLTRRASVKRTWPGFWTNSFCGHPAPGERIVDAVRRRAGAELGARISEPTVVLADFSYYAVMDDGTVENEICPVYVARLLTAVVPNPAEVDGVRWVPYSGLVAALGEQAQPYSPWMREQLQALLASGWKPPA